MSIARLALVLWLAFAVSLARGQEPAESCATAGGPIEVHLCLEPLVTAIEQELAASELAALQHIRTAEEFSAEYNVDRKSLLQAFQASQAAWRAHMQNECEARRLAFGSGSGANEAFEACYLTHHKQRVAELGKYWAPADP